ncbi:MAG: NAD(+) synthase [Treponema sp.]|uniref:NAD(+) synthase n=1 Tax=Treponema sp. TaxID=166 RepID=UPI001D5905EC|nr:NAD(+) synthase [Treponema sp.]MBS7310168.1 NAD(+) synthase [Treponema sp.]MDY5886319.1 NAD(+) synthase [Treponema sp.]
MKYGFVKTACASPRLKVADCNFNSEQIICAAKDAAKNGASVIVFPELSITGYTCGDLFFQRTLQNASEVQLKRIISETAKLDSVIFVGLPVPRAEGIYNCAAAIKGGELLALFAKSYLPNYGEFYERRHFTPFQQNMNTQFIDFAGFEEVPFGTDILIQDEKDSAITIGCELCEDLWVPVPPSSRHILAGATIIANLSGGNEIIGKADYRRSLVKSHSARSLCAYLYANAGLDESTQDMVFAGHNLISENGTLLAESSLFSSETIYADIDVERLCQERRRTTSFGFSANNNTFNSNYVIVQIKMNVEKAAGEFSRYVDPHPFVPSDKDKRTQRCLEVITLQAQGLAKRLRHINCQSAVIGLSGGLDSTLALLITCRAFDLCGIERSKVTAITMPCFGTTDRTYNNACSLAKECGATLKEVPIADAVRQHFADLGHDESLHDVTYENCQARERTQVLMDYANKTNGIVIGTGDLSELALGWCTYNGDHMSMYGVNSSIPKTLVRYLVQWFAEASEDAKNEKLASVLKDILDTPVSPELLPPKEGVISQVTEDLVGPYELHDFYLYYLLRFGFSPAKIYFLAQNANLPYGKDVILKWLKTFYRRFFTQQFKRSCMPDGAKVGTINLSPRGDWRMPSDAVYSAWNEELETLK